ncbi:MAG: hypothetical protein BRC31_08010 [Actinobacteria bacterium QS_5_72_10]|nr:MAG: hypothetical protein BRC31_08010 [Actinobacteria bacterium QS_5_72_10]
MVPPRRWCTAAAAAADADPGWLDADVWPVLLKALIVHAARWGRARDVVARALPEVDGYTLQHFAEILIGYGRLDPPTSCWYEHPQAGRRPFLVLTRDEAGEQPGEATAGHLPDDVAACGHRHLASRRGPVAGRASVANRRQRRA